VIWVVVILALLLAGAALAFAVMAWREATATRSELRRHRYSHTQQVEEPPARRHAQDPGRPPVADPHAAAPTAEIGALRPPGTGATGRRRVRDDPQA
jgi:hypothetical protein